MQCHVIDMTLEFGYTVDHLSKMCKTELGLQVINRVVQLNFTPEI